MNFLRGDSRRNLLGYLSGAGPAAASFLGLRIGRVVILRISALLALRTLISAVELPIDSGVVSYMWTFLFSLVQASVFAGMAASMFNLGGVLSLIARRLFIPSADSAFISLYGNMVMVLGPLCSSLSEAMVMTYEVMRISRDTSGKARDSEVQGGGKMLKRAINAFSFLCVGVSFFIASLVQQVYPGIVSKIMVSIVLMLVAVCLLTNDGLFLESSVLGLLSCIILSIGLIEEFDCPTSLLDNVLMAKDGEGERGIVKVFGSWYSLQSDQVRAMLLIYTTVMLMGTMARAPRFFYLTQVGSAALVAEEGVAAVRPSVGAAEGGLGQDAIGQAYESYELRGIGKGFYNGLVLVAMTFRVLVWSREVRVGEYLPGLCRFVQVVAMLLLHRVYAVFGRTKEEEQDNVDYRPRDMAGNIIENPIPLE